MTDMSADRDDVCPSTIADSDSREHFIPIRQADRVNHLVKGLPENERQRFIDVSQYHHDGGQSRAA
jgi:hypothetical protein